LAWDRQPAGSPSQLPRVLLLEERGGVALDVFGFLPQPVVGGKEAVHDGPLVIADLGELAGEGEGSGVALFYLRSGRKSMLRVIAENSTVSIV